MPFSDDYSQEFGDYMTKRALALHILVKQWHIIKNFAIETEKNHNCISSYLSAYWINSTMDYAVGLLLVSTAGSVADTEGEPRGSGGCASSGSAGGRAPSHRWGAWGRSPSKAGVHAFCAMVKTFS